MAAVPAAVQARRVVLMVFGENKAGMVRLVVEGPVSEQVPASYLQDHPHATAYLDYGAAAGTHATVMLQSCCAPDQLLLAASLWPAQRATVVHGAFSSRVQTLLDAPPTR